MSRPRVGTLLAFVLLLCASPAAAQICAGFPTADRGFSFGGHVAFPENGDEWGGEVSYNAAGPLSLFGGVHVEKADGADESIDTYHAGVALDSMFIPRTLRPRNVSVCPSVEVGYTNLEFGSQWQIPIGLGFGTTVQLTPSVPLSPYAIPQLVIHRLSGDDDLNIDSQTDTHFGFRGGVLTGFDTGFGSIYVGGEVTKLFGDDGNDALFGIRAGITVGGGG